MTKEDLYPEENKAVKNFKEQTQNDLKDANKEILKGFDFLQSGLEKVIEHTERSLDLTGKFEGSFGSLVDECINTTPEGVNSTLVRSVSSQIKNCYKLREEIEKLRKIYLKEFSE